MLGFTGKEATKEFEAAEHPDVAQELTKYLVGEYKEVHDRCDSVFL